MFPLFPLFITATVTNEYYFSGEKRKRKLQYLQQLLRDGESPERAAQTVEERERMVTPEYHSQRQPPPVFVVPSNSNFQPLAATSSNAVDPVFPLTTCYDRQLGRTAPSYASYEDTWSTQIYQSSPSVTIPSWTVPSWMPNVDYATTASSRSDEFQYTPPPHVHHTFEQVPTPPQQSRTPDSDLFLLGTYGHCRRADSRQPMGIPNVSVPSSACSASSSPFHYARYAALP